MKDLTIINVFDRATKINNFTFKSCDSLAKIGEKDFLGFVARTSSVVSKCCQWYY